MPGTNSKTPKRTNSRKKSAPRTQKKPKAPARKCLWRRKKKQHSDASRAVLLTAALIFLAAAISLAIVRLHSSANNAPAAEITAGEVPPEVMPEARPENDAPPPIAVPPEKPPAPRPAPSEKTPAAKPPAPETQAAPAKPAAPKPAGPAKPETPARQNPPAAKSPAKQTIPSAPQSTPLAPPQRPRPGSKGTLVFVIDDAGNNLAELEPFLKFPGPLTIAVLPGLPHSAEAARRIRAAGKEVFLHQPMEAIGGKYPGPGAIYSDMNAAEVRATLARNVAEIGPIAGMNNHQGSKITMSEGMMETVLSFCREAGLCFLDSRTTADTVAPAVAKQVGIKIGERNIFIDNEQDRASMRRYVNSGLALAERQGSAVMIGHTWSPELAPLLTELYAGFAEQGYSLNTAAAFIAK